MDQPETQRQEYLKSLLKTKRELRYKSIICSFIKRNTAENIGCLWKMSAKLHEHSIGWEFIARVRTGAVFWAPRLATIGRIHMSFKDTCPGCLLSVREDAEHVLRQCSV